MLKNFEFRPKGGIAQCPPPKYATVPMQKSASYLSVSVNDWLQPQTGISVSARLRWLLMMFVPATR